MQENPTKQNTPSSGFNNNGTTSNTKNVIENTPAQSFTSSDAASNTTSSTRSKNSPYNKPLPLKPQNKIKTTNSQSSSGMFTNNSSISSKNSSSNTNSSKIPPLKNNGSINKHQKNKFNKNDNIKFNLNKGSSFIPKPSTNFSPNKKSQTNFEHKETSNLKTNTKFTPLYNPISLENHLKSAQTIRNIENESLINPNTTKFPFKNNESSRRKIKSPTNLRNIPTINSDSHKSSQSEVYYSSSFSRDSEKSEIDNAPPSYKGNLVETKGELKVKELYSERTSIIQNSKDLGSNKLENSENKPSRNTKNNSEKVKLIGKDNIGRVDTLKNEEQNVGNQINHQLEKDQLEENALGIFFPNSKNIQPQKSTKKQNNKIFYISNLVNGRKSIESNVDQSAQSSKERKKVHSPIMLKNREITINSDKSESDMTFRRQTDISGKGLIGNIGIRNSKAKSTDIKLLKVIEHQESIIEEYKSFLHFWVTSMKLITPTIKLIRQKQQENTLNKNESSMESKKHARDNDTDFNIMESIIYGNEMLQIDEEHLDIASREELDIFKKVKKNKSFSFDHLENNENRSKSIKDKTPKKINDLKFSMNILASTLSSIKTEFFTNSPTKTSKKDMETDKRSTRNNSKARKNTNKEIKSTSDSEDIEVSKFRGGDIEETLEYETQLRKIQSETLNTMRIKLMKRDAEYELILGKNKKLKEQIDEQKKNYEKSKLYYENKGLSSQKEYNQKLDVIQQRIIELEKENRDLQLRIKLVSDDIESKDLAIEKLTRKNKSLKRTRKSDTRDVLETTENEGNGDIDGAHKTDIRSDRLSSMNNDTHTIKDKNDTIRTELDKHKTLYEGESDLVLKFKQELYSYKTLIKAKSSKINELQTLLLENNSVLDALRTQLEKYSKRESELKKKLVQYENNFAQKSESILVSPRSDNFHSDSQNSESNDNKLYSINNEETSLQNHTLENSKQKSFSVESKKLKNKELLEKLRKTKIKMKAENLDSRNIKTSSILEDELLDSEKIQSDSKDEYIKELESTNTTQKKKIDDLVEQENNLYSSIKQIRETCEATKEESETYKNKLLEKESAYAILQNEQSVLVTQNKQIQNEIDQTKSALSEFVANILSLILENIANIINIGLESKKNSNLVSIPLKWQQSKSMCFLLNEIFSLKCEYNIDFMHLLNSIIYILGNSTAEKSVLDSRQKVAEFENNSIKVNRILIKKLVDNYKTTELLQTLQKIFGECISSAIIDEYKKYMFWQYRLDKKINEYTQSRARSAGNVSIHSLSSYSIDMSLLLGRDNSQVKSTKLQSTSSSGYENVPLSHLVTAAKKTDYPTPLNLSNINQTESNPGIVLDNIEKSIKSTASRDYNDSIEQSLKMLLTGNSPMSSISKNSINVSKEMSEKSYQSMNKAKGLDKKLEFMNTQVEFWRQKYKVSQQEYSTKAITEISFKKLLSSKNDFENNQNLIAFLAVVIILQNYEHMETWKIFEQDWFKGFDAPKFSLYVKNAIYKSAKLVDTSKIYSLDSPLCKYCGNTSGYKGGFNKGNVANNATNNIGMNTNGGYGMNNMENQNLIRPKPRRLILPTPSIGTNLRTFGSFNSLGSPAYLSNLNTPILYQKQISMQNTYQQLPTQKSIDDRGKSAVFGEFEQINNNQNSKKLESEMSSLSLSPFSLNSSENGTNSSGISNKGSMGMSKTLKKLGVNGYNPESKSGASIKKKVSFSKKSRNGEELGQKDVDGIYKLAVYQESSKGGLRNENKMEDIDESNSEISDSFDESGFDLDYRKLATLLVSEIHRKATEKYDRDDINGTSTDKENKVLNVQHPKAADIRMEFLMLLQKLEKTHMDQIEKLTRDFEKLVVT
ncbi:hypothetical protein BB558_003682 [Smittium angustum]|uniref:Uncharacterized protein n=1 Tax=Smittium angustum TaxID=133377 RepID=A0A2U1J5C2_SMIAN|nr:hypothetical protein BB558_003682 [Smittium angustum]